MRSTILAATLVMGVAGSASAGTVDYAFNLDRVSGWLNDISSAVRVVVGIDTKTNTVSDFSINGAAYNVPNPSRRNDDHDAAKWESQYTSVYGERGDFTARLEVEKATGDVDESFWSKALTITHKLLGNAYASSSDHSAPVGVCRK